MGSIQYGAYLHNSPCLLGVLNKMGSILFFLGFYPLRCLLGVLNKMGSIPQSQPSPFPHSLLGVLNKMGSIPKKSNRSTFIKFARCVKQDGFYTIPPNMKLCR